jgi:hypothetical protein
MTQLDSAGANMRALEAKRRMDAAMEALCAAEAEWIAACQEADRIDGADAAGSAVPAGGHGETAAPDEPPDGWLSDGSWSPGG